jgi:urea transporter
MDEQAVALTRRYGAIISAVSVVVGLIYVVGLLRRSYWALALPVTAATMGALYISLWIGRALMTTPSEPTDF